MTSIITFLNTVWIAVAIGFLYKVIEPLVERFLHSARGQKYLNHRLNFFKNTDPITVWILWLFISLTIGFFLTMRCNNGEISWAIGHRGACSGKQGVQDRNSTLTLEISLLVATLASLLSQASNKRGLHK